MSTYGQIFSAQGANQNFGPVQNSIQIPVSVVKPLLGTCGTSIMFKVINNQVIVLDSHRNVIYPPSSSPISSAVVFSLYTTSVLKSLLDQGSGQNIEVQERTSVLSIGYGDKVMEVSTLCPPTCSSDNIDTL